MIIFQDLSRCLVYANKAVQSTFKYMYIGEFPLKIWDATSPESDHIYSENIVNYEENSDLSKEGRIRFKSLNWRYRILPDLSYFKNLNYVHRYWLLPFAFC